MGHKLTIGRGPKNDVQCVLPGVSWIHAELKLDVDGMSICDCSSNGTGIRTPDTVLRRLQKGIDTPMPAAAVAVLPFKIKLEAGKPAESLLAVVCAHVGESAFLPL